MSGDRNRFSRSRSPKPRWHEESSSSAPEAPTATNQIDSNAGSSTEEVSANADVNRKENVLASTETTLAAGTGDDTQPKIQRKRKWLSSETTAANLLSSKKVLTISTDTLKNYLPNVPAPSSTKDISNEDGEDAEVKVIKKADDEDSQSNPSTISDSTMSGESNINKRKVIENTSNEIELANNELKQQTSRTVILEVRKSFKKLSFFNIFVYILILFY
jgi:hypothetical protein